MKKVAVFVVVSLAIGSLAGCATNKSGLVPTVIRYQKPGKKSEKIVVFSEEEKIQVDQILGKQGYQRAN